MDCVARWICVLEQWAKLFVKDQFPHSMLPFYGKGKEGGERRKRKEGDNIRKIIWSSQNFPVDLFCEWKGWVLLNQPCSWTSGTASAQRPGVFNPTISKGLSVKSWWPPDPLVGDTGESLGLAWERRRFSSDAPASMEHLRPAQHIPRAKMGFFHMKICASCCKINPDGTNSLSSVISPNGLACFLAFLLSVSLFMLSASKRSQLHYV